MQPSEAASLLGPGLEIDDGTRLEALAGRLGEWPLLLRLGNRQLRELMEEEGLGVGEDSSRSRTSSRRPA